MLRNAGKDVEGTPGGGEERISGEIIDDGTESVGREIVKEREGIGEGGGVVIVGANHL